MNKTHDMVNDAINADYGCLRKNEITAEHKKALPGSQAFWPVSSFVCTGFPQAEIHGYQNRGNTISISSKEINEHQQTLNVFYHEPTLKALDIHGDAKGHSNTKNYLIHLIKEREEKTLSKQALPNLAMLTQTSTVSKVYVIYGIHSNAEVKKCKIEVVLASQAAINLNNTKTNPYNAARLGYIDNSGNLTKQYYSHLKAAISTDLEALLSQNPTHIVLAMKGTHYFAGSFCVHVKKMYTMYLFETLHEKYHDVTDGMPCFYLTSFDKDEISCFQHYFKQDKYKKLQSHIQIVKNSQLAVITQLNDMAKASPQAILIGANNAADVLSVGGHGLEAPDASLDERWAVCSTYLATQHPAFNKNYKSSCYYHDSTKVQKSQNKVVKLANTGIMITKKEFIATTRKLMAAQVFIGRTEDLHESIKLLCTALEEDKTLKGEQLSLVVTRGQWVPEQQMKKPEKDVLTPDEAWKFLYDGMGNLGNDTYKIFFRNEIKKEFAKNSSSYSEGVKNLWRTVFADQDGPVKDSRYADLSTFMDVSLEIKRFAPLFLQAMRSENSFFAKIPDKFNYMQELACFLELNGTRKNAQDSMSNELENAKQFFKNLRVIDRVIDNEYFKCDFETIISINPHGTHLYIESKGKFNDWFSKLPMKIAILLKNDLQIFKISDQAVAIGKGPNMPGIQIQIHDIKNNKFRICSNVTADKTADRKGKNDEHALILKKNHLQKMIELLPDVLSGKLNQYDKTEKRVSCLQQ